MLKWLLKYAKQILIGIIILMLILIFSKKSKAMDIKKNTTPGNNDTPEIKVLDIQKMRNDKNGQGHFGASRGSRKHLGLDLLAAPGANVFCNQAGTVTKIGYVYKGDSTYRSLHIELQDKRVLKFYYVLPGLKVGNAVLPGAIVGTAQNIAKKWGGGMLNHIHVEVLVSGKNVDPENFIKLNK
jgi:hypothetical protein